MFKVQNVQKLKIIKIIIVLKNTYFDSDLKRGALSPEKVSDQKLLPTVLKEGELF
jgi:hypothetical protein